MNLYEDQVEFIDKLRESLKNGHRSILGVASPAFGKTVVAGHIIRSSLQKGGSAWFIVHRKNLLRQTSKSFWKAKIEHGLLTSGKARSPMPVQVGTIGTVHSRMVNLNPPRLMFVDEAHLARGSMFEKAIKWALDAGSIVIGLTGTPERLDGKGLGYLFTDLVQAKSTSWLIQQGRLSDYRIYTTPILPDLSKSKNSGGDYATTDLADAMDNSAIVGDVISHYKTYANGMIAIAYCCTVQHSKNTAAEFNANGIPAVHVDASTTEQELQDACEGLHSGKYKVLVNCELAIEGFDLSMQIGKEITIECCILLRPTRSKARYLQMVFRAMRKKKNPAVILDHSGCCHMHGLPDDDHEWSLDGRKKASRKSDGSAEEIDIKITQCKKCFHVFRTGPSACPQCGSEIEIKTRRINHVDGELVQIDLQAERANRKQEQGKSRTLHDLVALGMRRGMNKPAAWAAITMAARTGKKPTSAQFSEANRILMEIKNEQRNGVNEGNNSGFV